MFIGTNVHSIDFFYDDPINEVAEGRCVNTWDDWHLVATSRPTISLPKFQENNVEITGMNGFVDVSRVLTGYPLYGARTGSIEFLILNQYNINNADYWTQTYHKVAHFLHGQRRKMVLHDDERNYYYDGVFTVDSFEPGENNSTITINYVLQPFKKARRLSDEEWIWDPFDLDYGLIVNQKFKDIIVDRPVDPRDPEMEIDVSGYIGEEPVVPVFYITFDKESPVTPINYVYPDVNNDGRVTTSDSTLILAAYSNLSTGRPSGLDGVYSHLTDAEPPIWESDTYYTLVDDSYILQTEEPTDWSTNWEIYYVQTVTPEDQEDRADADRDGEITAKDATLVQSFYSETAVGTYTNDLAGWIEFMSGQPSEITKRLWFRLYSRTVEGRITNLSVDIYSDGSVGGSDDITCEKIFEDEHSRTFKVASPHAILYGETVKFVMQGQATVNVSFREGRL